MSQVVGGTQTITVTVTVTVTVTNTRSFFAGKDLLERS
jgi:hypothetical protein